MFSKLIAWYVGLGVALLGFVMCFWEKQIKLRTTLDSEFGLDREKNGEFVGTLGTLGTDGNGTKSR